MVVHFIKEWEKPPLQLSNYNYEYKINLEDGKIIVPSNNKKTWCEKYKWEVPTTELFNDTYEK